MLDRDAVALRFLPRPDAPEELLAAQVVARLALLFLQLALDHHLRGDAGVVDARQPTDVVPAHPFVPGEHVLHGGGERVTQMQRSGDVGRRLDDGERRLVADVLRAEKTLFFPPLSPMRFDALGLVALVEIGRVRARLAHGARVIPQTSDKWCRAPE